MAIATAAAVRIAQSGLIAAASVAVFVVPVASERPPIRLFPILETPVFADLECRQRPGFE